MKLRQFMVGVVAATLGISGVAHAGQFSAEDLGQSLPMWMETLASINAHGDVAWTAWDGTATTATFYNAANDHVLSTSEAESWAVSISDHVIDGSNTIVGIAGSHASSQRLTDRSAVLWRVSWPTNSETASSQLLDLGATTDKLDGSEGTVQQSAAYAVLEKAGGGTARDFYVGGFARDKVNKSTFPQPVIWEISNAFTGNESIDVHPLPLINPGATVPSGYVASIAKNEDQGTIWACGNTSGAGDYNQATCWNLSGGIAGATVYTHMMTDLSSTAGLGAIPASSMVHRVRVVPIGPNGELHTVAVGSALMGSGNSRSWKGWAYDLDAGVLYKDLGLTGSTDHETFAYDVAALEYENGTATPSKGMIIAGISSSTAASEIGGLPGNIHNVPTTMRGVNRRMMLSGVTDTGQVCAIQDDSEDLQGTYQQLLALSADGRYRLATQGNHLVRLSAVVDEAEVEIRNRRTSSRTSTKTLDRDHTAHYQARATLGGTATALEGLLRFGSSLACSPVEISGPNGCHIDDPTTFDIADAGNGTALALHSPPNTPSNTLLSQKSHGSIFDYGAETYAQLALFQNNACTITPVLSAQSVDVDLREGAGLGAVDTDFDDESWTWCGPVDNWVKTETDVDHCAQCNYAVSSPTCADTVCNNGNPAIASVDAGHCAIGPNNQWECYNDGQRKPDSTKTYRLQTTYSSNTCGSASNVSRLDPCIRCDQSHSQTEWHEQKNTACCDANGNVLMDVYDRTVSANGEHLSCNDSTMGIDKNNGFSRFAWWVDPRGLNNNNYDDWKQYTQDSPWSNNGVCNLHSSSAEPQAINKSNNGSPGYVRRVRASFTPNIDENDWYGFQVDDSPNDAHTPKPRVRVISHNTPPGESRRARLRVCMYVDTMDGNQGQVSIKKVFFRNRGLGKLYPTQSTNNPMMVPLGNLTTPSGGESGGGFQRGDWLFDTNASYPWRTEGRIASSNDVVYYYNPEFNPHSQSPAYDARGGCFFTDDNGVVDISYADYDDKKGAKEEAWIYVAVSLAEPNADELSCDQLKYTMYYGNDRSSSDSGKSSMLNSFDYSYGTGCGFLGLGACTYKWHYGCDDCCHESEWE